MSSSTTQQPRKCQPAPVAILSAALRSSMLTEDASAADVAKWCDVDPRTVQRWLAGDTPVAVERVMRSRRLWPHFRQALSDYRRESERLIPIARASER